MTTPDTSKPTTSVSFGHESSPVLHSAGAASYLEVLSAIDACVTKSVAELASLVEPLARLRTLMTEDPRDSPKPFDNVCYTAKEVAKLLAITEKQVYELAKRDELTSVKLGRYVRFPRSALSARLAGPTDQPSGSEL